MRSTFFPLLVILLLVTTASSVCRAGDGFNNGGGISELNFSYAWSKLGDFANRCLSQPRCGLSESERRYLLEITAHMPEEARESSLRFEQRGAATPLASTQNRVGAPILVNQSLLYPLDGHGIPRPYPVSRAAQVLLETLAHHHRRTASDPAVLGASRKAAALANTQVQALDLGVFRHAEIQVFFLEGALPSWAITDGTRFEELMPYLSQALGCPQGSLLRSAQFWGTHWGNLPALRADGIQVVLLESSFSARCEGSEQDLETRGSVVFHIPFAAPPLWRMDPKLPLRLIPGSIRAEVVDLH